MRFSGPASIFQKLRYGTIARTVSRLNSRFRLTGSPEFRPLIIQASEKATVVSISPHPDDDILAVGGALAGHIVAGGDVHSIILTDGACGTEDASEKADLIAIRREECQLAADVINLTSISFWEEPDGNLRANRQLVEDLVSIIRRIRPDYVYTPFPLDYHFDHIEAARITSQAVAQIDDPPLIRCYECIIPLIPNKIVDISGFIDIKRRAVASFETQNEVSDYGRTVVEGLNRHRSYGQMAGKGYGEAIFETDHAFLANLIKMLHGK